MPNSQQEYGPEECRAVNAGINHLPTFKRIVKSGLPATQLSILYFLLHKANYKTGQCNPGYNTIAKGSGMARTTAMRHIDRLCDAEWLVKHTSGDDSNEYGLLFCVKNPIGMWLADNKWVHPSTWTNKRFKFIADAYGIEDMFRYIDEHYSPKLTERRDLEFKLETLYESIKNGTSGATNCKPKFLKGYRG